MNRDDCEMPHMNDTNEKVVKLADVQSHTMVCTMQTRKNKLNQMCVNSTDFKITKTRR